MTMGTVRIGYSAMTRHVRPRGRLALDRFPVSRASGAAAQGGDEYALSMPEGRLHTPGGLRVPGVLVPYVALVGAAAWLGIDAGAWGTAEGRTWFVLGGVAASEAIPLVLVWAGWVGNWLGHLGVLRPPRAGPSAWVLGLVVACAYVAATATSNPVIARHMFDMHVLQLLGVAAAAVAALLEEGVFRRLLMDGLARRGASPLVQIAISALAFGAAHAAWGLASGRLEVAAIAAAATTLLGAGLAVTYLLGRRSLGPCVASHFAIDLLLEPWLIYAALGGGSQPVEEAA